MDKSFLDETVDILMEDVGSVKTQIKEMFKGKRPFRVKSVSAVDLVAHYVSTPDEVKNQFRTNMPEAWNAYEGKVLKAIERYKNG